MSYFKKEDYKPDNEAKKAMYISLFFISILFFGLVLGGLYFVSKLVQISKYQEISGTVINSRVVEYRGSKGQRLHKPEIVYEYSIDGERHRSNVYDYFQVQKGYLMSSEIVKENPPNKEIKIYVNPKDVNESVLDKEIHPYYFMMLPFMSSILFFWLMTYRMFITGNYYMLYTKGKNRLVFAYPTAFGFACTTAGITTIICGFYPIIMNFSLKWSFFVIWIFLVSLSYFFGYFYKSNNLRFSERVEKMIIDSERYKKEGRPVSLFQQEGSKKILFLIIMLIILINLIIITRLLIG